MNLRPRHQVVKETFAYKYTKADPYQDPNMMPNLTALRHTIDIMQSLGFLREVRRKQYVDLSYVKEAAAREVGDRLVRTPACASAPRAPLEYELQVVAEQPDWRTISSGSLCAPG
jgi:hypothetical protein